MRNHARANADRLACSKDWRLKMAVLKYFKRNDSKAVLPSPDGPLSSTMPCSSIIRAWSHYCPKRSLGLVADTSSSRKRTRQSLRSEHVKLA